MPTYHIRDTETEEVYEEFCSYTKLQEFLKENPKYKQVPMAPNIVTQTVGSNPTDSRTDNGWKENLSRIAEAHPTSALAERYGNKSTKDIKTQGVLRKHGMIK
tara:strand:+ start:83 stop:391 length:309 start_codon:yes stop_codon:yes gene_type:complete